MNEKIQAVIETFLLDRVLCGRVEWRGTMEDVLSIADGCDPELRAQLPRSASWMGQRLSELGGAIRCEWTGDRVECAGYGVPQRVYRVFLYDAAARAAMLLRRMAALGGEFEALRSEVRDIHAVATGGVA